MYEQNAQSFIEGLVAKTPVPTEEKA